MAVFYKYVERQVSDQINWADISKSLSQTFDAERDAREKKKDEINQASLEYIEKLQSQPQTKNSGVNERIGQLTSDTSSYLKTLLDDLKAGRITLKDYTVRSQNLKSDANVSMDFLQAYGKRAAEVIDGMNSKKLSSASNDVMARVEGFGNLANNRFYIEPTSGKLYIADEVLDPVTGIKKMGNKVQNITAMKQMMEQDIPRVDVNSELDARAKSLGGFINEEIKRGKFYSTAEGIKFEDATKQQYYDKYLTDLTEELVGGASNPSTVSFFVDNMKVAPNGKPYKIVFSEEERKEPSDILITQNGSGFYFAEPTKEQIKDAEEYVKIQMRQKIKSSTERDIINLPQPPQPKSDGDGKPKTDDKNIANQILLIKYGTREQKMSAFASLEGLESMQGKKFKIDANNNVFIVDTKDPNKASQPVSMNISDYDFVNAFAGTTGITDAKKGYNAAIQGGRFKGLSPQFLGALESQKKDVDYAQQFRNYALPVLNNIRLSGPEEDVVPKLQESEFAKWGYKFEQARGGKNFVKITAPPAKDLTTGAVIDGDPVTIEINLSNPKTYKQAIFDFIKMNPPSMYDLGTLRSLMDVRPNTSAPAANNSTVVPGANSR